MRNEIEAGRAAMPDRDAEIAQEAARAMLAALRAITDGLTSAFTNTGSTTATDVMMAVRPQMASARAAIALAERGA